MNTRPVIGITASEEEIPWGDSTRRAAVLPGEYRAAIERAGAAVLVLPVQGSGVEELVVAVDGIVLSGGPDVAPDHYGELSHPRTGEPDAARDALELALVAAATEADLPLLAICRGIQVLNVARGGTLHQHLPDVVGHEDHARKPGEYSPHPVEIRAESQLATILPTRLDVAGHHHQAIARVGEDLDVVALADDGTVEAVEDPNRAFIVGVQWHPEVGGGDALFVHLVEAARAHRRERS
jgi:gamma-glutamyl-gamma-aminobutyrate hydrolase PuuD